MTFRCNFICDINNAIIFMSESRLNAQESIIGQCNSDSNDVEFWFVKYDDTPRRFYYFQVRSSFVYLLSIRLSNFLERDRNPNMYGGLTNLRKDILHKRKTYFEELTFPQRNILGNNFTVCKHGLQLRW